MIALERGTGDNINYWKCFCTECHFNWWVKFGEEIRCEDCETILDIDIKKDNNDGFDYEAFKETFEAPPSERIPNPDVENHVFVKLEKVFEEEGYAEHYEQNGMLPSDKNEDLLGDL